jgi:hypothetical protein
MWPWAASSQIGSYRPSLALVVSQRLNPLDGAVQNDGNAIGRHPLRRRALEGLNFLRRLTNQGNGLIRVFRS